MTLQTALIDGEAVGRTDETILSALAGTWSDDPAPVRLRIAVRNDAGRIYRTIGFQRLSDMVVFFNRIVANDFVSEISTDQETIEGYNMILRHRNLE